MGRYRSVAQARVFRFALIGGLLLAVGAFAGSSTRGQELTKVTVALDWYPNANHAGIYLALDRGYFAAEGLDVEVYTPADPSTVLQTVGAGRDTFGISYQTDVLLARAQDVPVVSIAALVQHPLMGIMVAADAGISRPRDLVGKTVAYPGIPSQEAFLATMLEVDGATLQDIELVNVSFELIPALLSGRADAAMGAFWTHETILAAREGLPVDLLRVEAWGVPDYYELVLTASEETVADRPEVARAFLRALQHGYTDAAADQSAALDALATAFPELDREVEAEGLALLVPVWSDPATPFGTQTRARWTAFGAWMTSRALIPADLDISRAYATDLVAPPPATPVAAPTP